MIDDNDNNKKNKYYSKQCNECNLLFTSKIKIIIDVKYMD